MFMFFSQSLKRYPYATNSISAGTLFLIGDVLCQNLEGKKFDSMRSLRLTCFGCFVSGPSFCAWYRWLNSTTLVPRISEAIFPKVINSTHGILATKVFLDMVVFEPPYLAFFFASNEYATKREIEPVKKKLQSKFIPTYKADLMVWTPVQTLNLGFMPAIFQPIVINVVCIFWNAFLSFKLNQKDGTSVTEKIPMTERRIPNDVKYAPKVRDEEKLSALRIIE